MIKNFNFTQCNSAVSILEHQAQVKERMGRLHLMALEATGFCNAPEDEVRNMSDRTQCKVICKDTVCGLSVELRLSIWSKKQLETISRYLTDKETALFVYMSYEHLEADFILKYENEIYGLFDKIAKYLGVVVLACGAFNGIDYRFGTLDVIKGAREIADVEPHEINQSFVDIMMFKTKPEVSKMRIGERWDAIEETINNGDDSMKAAFDLVYEMLGSNPLDVSVADMLIVMRRNLGLTQKEFAERYNIPLGTYNHWEQGVRKPLDYVMHMLYRLVADDLLFADRYDLHSVYSVIAQYMTTYGDSGSPYIILETKDDMILENSIFTKLDDYVENHGDTKMKKILSKKETSWLKDIMSKVMDVDGHFTVEEVLLNYSDVKVIESQTLDIKGFQYLKLKLNITTDDIRTQSFVSPKSPSNDTFDLNTNGRYEEELIMGKCVSYVADWLVRSMSSSLSYYHFFNIADDDECSNLKREDIPSVSDVIEDITYNGSRVKHVTPILMLLTNTCYNTVFKEPDFSLDDCIGYLYGKNSDEVYITKSFENLYIDIFDKKQDKLKSKDLNDRCTGDDTLKAILLKRMKNKKN